MTRLGITHHFEGIFDIHAADYLPKPARSAYDKFLSDYDVDPTRAVMLEDIARNLEPAHALGMTTVWIRSEHDTPPWAPTATTSITSSTIGALARRPGGVTMRLIRDKLRMRFDLIDRKDCLTLRVSKGEACEVWRSTPPRPGSGLPWL